MEIQRDFRELLALFNARNKRAIERKKNLADLEAHDEE